MGNIPSVRMDGVISYSIVRSSSVPVSPPENDVSDNKPYKNSTPMTGHPQHYKNGRSRRGYRPALCHEVLTLYTYNICHGYQGAPCNLSIQHVHTRLCLRQYQGMLLPLVFHKS